MVSSKEKNAVLHDLCVTLVFIFFEYRQSELRSVRGGGPAWWAAAVR